MFTLALTIAGNLLFLRAQMWSQARDVLSVISRIIVRAAWPRVLPDK